jgi:hypothetical protein
MTDLDRGPDRDPSTTCGTEDPAEACPRCRVVFSSSQLMALHYAHTHGEGQ